MIQTINHKTKLQEINKNIKTIYLTRPIALKKIKKIMNERKNIQEIRMNQSTYYRLKEKTKNYFNEKQLFIKIENQKGRPLKNSTKIIEAIKLFQEGKSLRKIEKKLKIPKSTVHYLLKYAKRSKITGEKGEIIIIK